MEQNDKHAFWRFTIRYNLLLLAGLYFLILGFAVSGIADRIDGIMNGRKMLMYFIVLVGAFVATQSNLCQCCMQVVCTITPNIFAFK